VRGHGILARGRRSGTTAIEFALIAVPFLGLLLFVLQLGFVLYAQIAVDYATVRAARLLQVDSAQGLSTSRATFQAATFCPLLAPLLACTNVLIGLHQVTPDYLTDLKATPQKTSGVLAQPSSFTPGQSGALMVLQVTYFGPAFTWPVTLRPAATYNGASGTAIVSSAPFANEY
jgi:Flp pilus assembly protein TadG